MKKNTFKKQATQAKLFYSDSSVGQKTTKVQDFECLYYLVYITQKVGLTGKFYLKDGGRSKFLEAMKKNVDFSKTEVGVRHYKLNADFKNPLIFWLVQEWDTVTDLRKHCTSEAYVKNGKMLQDILEEPMWQIGLYKALD